MVKKPGNHKDKVLTLKVTLLYNDLEPTCLSRRILFICDLCLLRLNDKKRSRHQNDRKNKTQHCRGAVGKSTRAVACAFASEPQPFSEHIHPCCSSSTKASSVGSALLVAFRLREIAFSCRPPRSRREVRLDRRHNDNLLILLHLDEWRLRQLSGSRRHPSTSAEYE